MSTIQETFSSGIKKLSYLNNRTPQLDAKILLRHILDINNEKFELKKNDSAYVPPNSEQFLENIGSEKLRFLCIVEPAWKPEDDKLLE